MTGFYDPLLLVLSWGVATLASLAFFRVASSLPALNASAGHRWWSQGTAVAGAGLWAAHAVGLLAYRLPIDPALSPMLLVASVVPAWLGVGAALRLAGRTPCDARAVVLAASALVAGIGATHFVGTSAWRVGPYVGHDVAFRLAALAGACLLVAALLALNRGRTSAAALLPVPAAAAGLGTIVVLLQMAGFAAVQVQADSVALAPGVGAAAPWIAVMIAAVGIGPVLALFAVERRRSRAGHGVTTDAAFAAFEATPVVPAAQVGIGSAAIVADAVPGEHPWDTAAGPVAMFRTDTGHPDVLGRFSPNAAVLWGYAPDALGAITALTDVFHEHDWNADRAGQWRRRFAAGALRLTEDIRVRRADGVYRWHQLSLAPLGAATGPTDASTAVASVGWIGHLVDIDERKHAELHAHAQIRRLAELADGQRDASRDAALLEDTREMLHLAETLPEAREIIRRACLRLLPGWSGALTQMDGDARVLLTTRWGDRAPMVERFSPRDCWAFRSHRVHCYSDPAENAVCTHLVHDAAEVPPPHFCLPIVDHREAIGAVHLFAPHDCDAGDVETLRPRMDALARMLGQALSNLRLRLALREQALRDALTGLYQRRILEEELPAEIQRAHRERRAVCIAILDIDGLATFNELHGREAGDGVLASIGRILNGSLRGYDTACRVGGEEVVLVLPGCELEDALIRLEEIRCSVEALRLEHGGAPLPVVTISVGIAEARGGTADALMLRAGEALQRAKDNGRNRIELAEREGPVLA